MPHVVAAVGPASADRCPGSSGRRWTGRDLAVGLSAAAAWLQAHARRLDLLNVYPVPDGDTGTNMSLTLAAAAEAARRSGPKASEVARVASQAALLGSRGNSGVILAQCLRGFAQAVGQAVDLGVDEVQAGLQGAARAAYASVVAPAEGTMLTAARLAAEAVAATRPCSPLEALRLAEQGARRAVETSPDLLPMLRDAGVVDAGAEGLRLVLEALLAAAEGRSLDPSAVPPPPEGVLARARAGRVEGDLGYCTEFVLRDARLGEEEARRAVSALGSSVIVVAEADALRVHLHTQRPAEALEFALRHGALDNVKVENMERQHRQQVGAPLSRSRVGLVAVASGAGLSALFADLGASVVDGGPTMSPSVAALAAALLASPPGPAILLANHPNVVPAARQAVALSGRTVDVIETRSPAQGLSAAVVFAPDADFEENRRRLRAAVARTRTLDLARASRAARVDGVEVRAGDYLARLDGRAVASSADPIDALADVLRVADVGRYELLSAYWGEGAPADLERRLRERLSRLAPRLAVEFHEGGQLQPLLLLTLE